MMPSNNNEQKGMPSPPATTSPSSFQNFYFIDVFNASKRIETIEARGPLANELWRDTKKVKCSNTGRVRSRDREKKFFNAINEWGLPPTVFHIISWSMDVRLWSWKTILASPRIQKCKQRINDGKGAREEAKTKKTKTKKQPNWNEKKRTSFT